MLQLSNQVASLLLQILSPSLPYSHATLVVDAFNAFFSQAAVVQHLSQDVIPAVLHTLIERCALPDIYFQTGEIPRGDTDQEFHRFRQACQDLVLAIASSPAGIIPTATLLLETLPTENSSFPREESILYLFCGVVDAIEEELLPLFSGPDRFYGETPSGDREDIPETPLETPYDSLFLFVFQRLSLLSVNVPLLVASLQIFFAFDNWTFSRPDYCQEILSVILKAFPRAPLSMMSRLLLYVTRLLDAPKFHFTVEQVQQLLDVFPKVLDFNELNLRETYLRTVSSAVSSLPPSTALSQFATLLAALLLPLPPLVSFLTNETSPSPSDLAAIVSAGIDALRNAQNVLEGCTLPQAALALTDALVPAAKTISESLLSREEAVETKLPLLRETTSLLRAMVQATEGEMGDVNTAVVCELCGVLLSNSICTEEALGVVESLLSTCFDKVGEGHRSALLDTVDSLLSWTLQTHTLLEALESTKRIMRIQFVLVKGEKRRLQEQPQKVMEIAQLTLGVSRERINEDEVIRLLLRTFSFLLQVGKTGRSTVELPCGERTLSADSARLL